MTELTARGITKSFGPVPVLEGIDLTVPDGSLTAILGPSGCGKTTLLRLVAGFDRPDAGTIVVGDETVFDRSTFVPPERRHIGYVAQEGALFPHLTVAANITFGLPRARRRAHHRVAELLEMVGLDASHAHRFPHELSGGQQQRVAVARALAPDPGLVLLDEPFSSLDAALRDDTRQAVAAALAAAGTTAVLVTHDQAEALSMATQVAVMQHGRFRQVGPPVEVYRHPVDLEVATFVGDAGILPAVVSGDAADGALGRLPLARPVPAGPVSVMIRPEQIVLRPVNAETDARAVVGEATYYGEHTIVRLDLLPDGPTITARLSGSDIPPPGQPVSVSVTGAVEAYPIADTSLP